MKTFESVEDMVDYLDGVVGTPDAQHEVMWDTVLQLPATARLRALSPFSTEYEAVCLSLYNDIAGRPYEPTINEMAPFSGSTASFNQPPPYNFGSSKSLGDYYLAWGGILKTLDVRSGDDVLEYGPGDGHITLALARMGCNAFAVDIEKRYLDTIEAHASRLGTSVTTQQALFGEGFSGRQFDRILFFEAFHHSFLHTALLQRLRNMLKPGGFLVFSGEPIVERASTAFIPFPWGPRLDGQSVWCMRKYGWMELGFERIYFVELLMRCGFVVYRWMNPAAGLGNCFIARPNTGELEVGRCEVDAVVDEAGWYPAEGSHRWTSGNALIPLDLTRQGTVRLDGINHLTVRKKLLLRCGNSDASLAIDAGCSFSLSVVIGKNATRLEIETTSHIPAALGINDDQRPLGLAITKLAYLD